MLQGFKDFILRGNVVELAVAVVIGTAFTAIVTAFSDHIINPLLAAVGGSPDVNGLAVQLIGGNPETVVDFGAVITAAINFLMIAAIIYFVLIMPMNKLNEALQKRKGVVEAEEEPASLEANLLEEIRDLLRSEQSSEGRHQA
ncbi:large conductance mechanosensitive channel protein MscL [Corynebacterium halotolerans]|uniref:large conductance mechanosensitive channel protein MscL n=1 Tax=Corynebacterium halotolerans TaxID=225326 RepID=UPI003CF523DA